MAYSSGVCNSQRIPREHKSHAVLYDFRTSPTSAGSSGRAAEHMIQRAKHVSTAAQDRQKHYADRRRWLIQYELEQWVWLSLKNLKFKEDGTDKLLPQYIGPFQITQLIGADNPNARPAPAVKLGMPRLCRIHDVFHVSLLVPYLSRPGVLPNGQRLR